ncbi:MAG: glycoside hydrolase family 15 protein [Rhizobiales bacterium]|nr:glycoside hydrolase family 15 protein [Hyphomicrobiales bacterium]
MASTAAGLDDGETPILKPASDETQDPPIKDYAVIGDCRTVALISRQGSIDWLCLPDVSSPSVFAALLDRRRGGRFAIRPAGAFGVERRYLDETNVLETVFTTEGGIIRIADFMPIKTGRGLEPEHEIVRIVEGLEGETEVEALYQPRPDYARAKPRFERRGALGWVFQCRGGAFLLAAETELALTDDGAGLNARFRLGPGERMRFSFVHATHEALVIPPLGEAADRRLASTVEWWRAWSRQCNYRQPHRPAVLRSLLLLKLLTYSQSGAVLAAPTTSLPEAIGGERNYDYRYCWLRDASNTLRAFFDLGYHAEGEAFLEWLLHSTRLTRPKLQVVYDVYGRTGLDQKNLDHLGGYRQSRPVRIGNNAEDQLQLDVYGSVVFGAHYYVDRGGVLDRAQRKHLPERR